MMTDKMLPATANIWHNRSMLLLVPSLSYLSALLNCFPSGLAVVQVAIKSCVCESVLCIPLNAYS